MDWSLIASLGASFIYYIENNINLVATQQI